VLRDCVLRIHEPLGRGFGLVELPGLEFALKELVQLGGRSTGEKVWLAKTVPSNEKVVFF
jgi:hypothetical protein